MGLAGGGVADVRVESTMDTGHSTLSFLHVTYAALAGDTPPERLVLKRTGLATGTEPHPAREADFYAAAAPGLPSPPVPRCVGVRLSSRGDAGYLLIEDLRATHASVSGRLPLRDEDAASAVDALARIHAAKWEAGDTGAWPGSHHTEHSLREMVAGIAAHLPAFLEAAGSALAAEDRRLYDRVFASALRPWLRLVDGRALTLAHGDAHAGNFLFPRDPAGPVYLIDWELWHADVGARDLAFMMALYWPPDRRRALERPLLRRYLDRLEALGVRGYGWDELWADYRRCVVRNLTVPVLFWRRGMPEAAWRARLACALAAYRDLDCDEIL
ncbi:MAG TPA: aminoglycoside phosphotransferase family protein [Longimicrobium sp.]|jgi:aminoglycoside phosphotransferase (APT) family kinase protein